ncbi:unnamed protein product [Spirodela intermedia]|uniref:CRIB domain-containing protein n=1 Tax=Spirodela intermedia TaxID=51605 RepID=A0A7I8LH81_SPIIN|nr:unnamed protein product [Spirodela intermedia]
MATKMKGFFKGFKYFSQIFAYKEHEMEIGYPTDVRHVTHIGWNSSPANAPSWMNEFKTASDFSVASLGGDGPATELSWASSLEDYEPPGGLHHRSASLRGAKKGKKKKPKQTSPSSSPTSRRSFAASQGGAGDFSGRRLAI